MTILGGEPFRSRFDALLARMRLHHVLFIVFTLISVVPVVFLTVHVQRTALDKEFAAVTEKHLLLAHNLTGALERYVTDAETAFRVAAQNLDSDQPAAGLRELLIALHFGHVCLIDEDGNVSRAIVGTEDRSDPAFAPAVMERLRPDLERARGAPGTVSFSNVVADAAGEPAIFLIMARPDDGFVVGALATHYVRAVQEAITFGGKGHAAIIDRAGRVIAHPNQEWRRAMRDISQVAPVAMMMRGETGVTEFFSPAVQDNMIAGFTVVPRTGWGVMIPQPVGELVAQANRGLAIAYAIAALGVVIAAVIGWWLAGVLARPIQNVVESARKIAGGQYGARVEDPGPALPSELRELGYAFNYMADEVEVRSTELNESAQRARAASHAKSEFLANMGHELRTPLNAIIGFAEVIKLEMMGPVQNLRYRDYARDIHESAVHLLGMINDTLDLSKVEAGQLEIRGEWIDVPKLLGDCTRMLRSSAEAAEIRLSLEIEAGVPAIHSDKGRLRQILINLLSNAIKFTPTGGRVTLTASSAPGGDGVRIVLRDTGIGIRPEDQRVVLTPFGQVKSVLTRRHHGTGLGLPLARKLVDLLGGHFELRSQLGVGTVVELTFPVEGIKVGARAAAE